MSRFPSVLLNSHPSHIRPLQLSQLLTLAACALPPYATCSSQSQSPGRWLSLSAYLLILDLVCVRVPHRISCSSIHTLSLLQSFTPLPERCTTNAKCSLDAALLAHELCAASTEVAQCPKRTNFVDFSPCSRSLARPSSFSFFLSCSCSGERCLDYKLPYFHSQRASSTPAYPI